MLHRTRQDRPPRRLRAAPPPREAEAGQTGAEESEARGLGHFHVLQDQSGRSAARGIQNEPAECAIPEACPVGTRGKGVCLDDHEIAPTGATVSPAVRWKEVNADAVAFNVPTKTKCAADAKVTSTMPRSKSKPTMSALDKAAFATMAASLNEMVPDTASPALRPIFAHSNVQTLSYSNVIAACDEWLRHRRRRKGQDGQDLTHGIFPRDVRHG